MTMSPKTKKILMIGGAAIAGYVVYTKFIKKPAAPVMTAPTKAQLISAGTIKTAAIQLATAQIAATKAGSATGLGVLEELGVEESLGSLGGSCFR